MIEKEFEKAVAVYTNKKPSINNEHVHRISDNTSFVYAKQHRYYTNSNLIIAVEIIKSKIEDDFRSVFQIPPSPQLKGLTDASNRCVSTEQAILFPIGVELMGDVPLRPLS